MLEINNKLKESKLSLAEEITNNENLRNELQEEITKNQQFLDSAKARQKLTGEYTNPEKWSDARGIVRDKTNQLHSVNRRIKELNRILSSQLKGSRFQQIAKETLEPDVYNQIEEKIASWKSQNK